MHYILITVHLLLPTSFFIDAGVYYEELNGKMLRDSGYSNYQDSLAMANIGDWNNDWATLSGRAAAPKCIDIPANMTLCHDIGYNKMRLPNLLDHDTILEATQQASSWNTLLGIKCHADAQLFLCSLFSPVCLDHLIKPCKSLCLSVKNGCEKHLQNYGYPWPEILSCEKFPTDNDLCIKERGNAGPKIETTVVEENICSACEPPADEKAMKENFCLADVVVKMKVQKAIVSGNLLRVFPRKKKKFYKSEGLDSSMYSNLEFLIENGAECECPHIDIQPSDYVIVTAAFNEANKNQLYIQSVMPYDKGDSAQKKAMRFLRKNNECPKTSPAVELNFPSSSIGISTASPIETPIFIDNDVGKNNKNDEKDRKKDKKRKKDGSKRNRKNDRDEKDKKDKRRKKKRGRKNKDKNSNRKTKNRKDRRSKSNIFPSTS